VVLHTNKWVYNAGITMHSTGILTVLYSEPVELQVLNLFVFQGFSCSEPNNVAFIYCNGESSPLF